MADIYSAIDSALSIKFFGRLFTVVRKCGTESVDPTFERP